MYVRPLSFFGGFVHYIGLLLAIFVLLPRRSLTLQKLHPNYIALCLAQLIDSEYAECFYLAVEKNLTIPVGFNTIPYDLFII